MSNKDELKQVEEFINIAKKENNLPEINKDLLDLLANQMNFIKSYYLLLDNKYLIPAISIARSFYECYLWTRWILLSKSNYKEFKRGNAITLNKMGKNLLLNKIAKITGPNKEVNKSIEDKLFKKEKYPSFDKIAKDIKIHYLHSIMYNVLSGVSHSSWSNNSNIKGSSTFIDANQYERIIFTLLIDSYELCIEWFSNSKYKELPDFIK